MVGGEDPRLARVAIGGRTMKASHWIGIGALITLSVLAVALVGGWWLWDTVFPRLTVQAEALPQAETPVAGCGASMGMMGWGTARSQTQGEFCSAAGGCGAMASGCPMADSSAPGEGEALTLEEARTALEAYLKDSGNEGLELVDLMEFEHNFYAIAREVDTGTGAMELLVNKWTGAVSPEMGPNMMWNAKYGMHRRGMMGGAGVEPFAAENTLSAEEALKLAQAWLDENQPGVSVEADADSFYGYFTIHALAGERIEGMVSVHGRTGQVWYHSWHGAFIQAEETGE